MASLGATFSNCLNSSFVMEEKPKASLAFSFISTLEQFKFFFDYFRSPNSFLEAFLDEFHYFGTKSTLI